MSDKLRKNYKNAMAIMRHNARFATHLLQSQYPVPDQPLDGASLVFIHTGKIFVSKGIKSTILENISPDIPGDLVKNAVYLGHRGSQVYYAITIPDGMTFHKEGIFYGVRELAGLIPDDELAIAGLAIQLIHYDQTTRFCGRCGMATISSQTERAKICPSCNHVMYPRLSPAIIVLIQNKNSILMVRGRDGPSGRYGLIAGFVEPCETVEQAVHREVREEVGISIKNIRYCASEPWPFPDSLMLGFIAYYDDGEIIPDGNEIKTAAWFDRDHLPELPPRFSITRALIDEWIEGGFDQKITSKK